MTQGNGSEGFPIVPVVVSAAVLIIIGGLLLSLGVQGALPTGLGLGAGLAPVTRNVVIGVILLAILVVLWYAMPKKGQS